LHKNYLQVNRLYFCNFGFTQFLLHNSGALPVCAPVMQLIYGSIDTAKTCRFILAVGIGNAADIRMSLRPMAG
jgi:hypothetical protein